jgi:hypothetical protein
LESEYLTSPATSDWALIVLPSVVQFQADMTENYEVWLAKVKDALSSINMAIDDWQTIWPFDFREEFGLPSAERALRAV